MQSLRTWHFLVAFCFALMAIYLGIEYAGQRLHALSPTQKLVEKMLVVKIEVDSALKSNTNFDKSKINIRDAQLLHEGIQLTVEIDGEIDGTNGEIKIKFTPKKEGDSIRWTCSGTPKDKLPASCK